MQKISLPLCLGAAALALSGCGGGGDANNAATAQPGEAQEAAEANPVQKRRKESLAGIMRWLQWATPAATGGLLVLDAYLGEQQRGAAGLLDRPMSLLRRR